MTKTERVDSTLKWGFRLIGLAVLGITALVMLSVVVILVAEAIAR